LEYSFSPIRAIEWDARCRLGELDIDPGAHDISPTSETGGPSAKLGDLVLIRRRVIDKERGSWDPAGLNLTYILHIFTRGNRSVCYTRLSLAQAQNIKFMWDR